MSFVVGNTKPKLAIALVVSASVAALAWRTSAHASPRDTPTHQARKTEQAEDPFKVGALAGVGFPHPFSIEGLVKLGGYVALGADYGLLPTVSVSGVDTRMWSLEGDLRVFPFRSVLFLGMRAGFQRVDASSTLSVPLLGTVTESAELDAWVINPRVGILWTSPFALAVGMDAGVQIPLATSLSTTIPAPYSAALAQSYPIRALGGVLPTIDLLRIGLMF